MTVIARVDWVRRQLEMGRRGHIAIGESFDKAKTKIKIILEPASSGQIFDMVMGTLKLTLDMVRSMMAGRVVTNRR